MGKYIRTTKKQRAAFMKKLNKEYEKSKISIHKKPVTHPDSELQPNGWIVLQEDVKYEDCWHLPKGYVFVKNDTIRQGDMYFCYDAHYSNNSEEFGCYKPVNNYDIGCYPEKDEIIIRKAK